MKKTAGKSKLTDNFPFIKTAMVADLIPYARNSRTHSIDQINQIAASIKEFGFLNPIIVDGENGIIAGHGRVLAAQKLGMAELPCVEASHLDDNQRRAYIIADNKLALNAGWDIEALQVEIEALDLAGFDLALTGFSSEEIAAMTPEAIAAGLTDEDAVPEPHTAMISVLGDVWLMGGHRVMCGDSTSVDAVGALMAGGLADELITDPPYNVAYVGKTKDAMTIKNDSMSDDRFRQFLRDAFVAAGTAMKAGGVFYIWHADSEGYNFRGACHDAGWTVRQCLIWKKQTLVMGRQDYHWKHEPCLYGWKDGAGHLWASDRKQTTVLEFDRPMRSDLHPTMKPVELIQYQVLNNTKGGDVVLDIFGGSGTTLIACEKTGRHARLMELDPKYVDVIVRRWQDFTSKQASLESTGEMFAAVAERAGR